MDALNNTNLEQRKYATSIQQNEFNLDEQRRQFEAQQAAARKAAADARAGFSMGGLMGGGGAASQAAPKATTPSLQSYLAGKYQQAPGANRQTQDSWVKEWAAKARVPTNNAELWAAYNKLYPWEQYGPRQTQSAPGRPIIVKSGPVTY